MDQFPGTCGELMTRAGTSLSASKMETVKLDSGLPSKKGFLLEKVELIVCCPLRRRRLLELASGPEGCLLINVALQDHFK